MSIFRWKGDLFVTHMTKNEPQWYSVKCVFVFEGTDSECLYRYEERITVWKAFSFDDAIEIAENEARKYESLTGAKYAGYSMTFHMYTDPAEGKEVFSIIRDSDLETDEYLDQFYDTGNERTQEYDPEGKLENLLDYEQILLQALETTRRKIKKLKQA